MARLKRGGSRFLATVLFTDIVDSTRLASELGDDAWRSLLAQQRELIRRQLRFFEGREVDTAGDGFFAVFDAPARAVGCALAIARVSQELGAQVRAGVHMGEVEEMARGALGGIAVHIGARIAAAAEGNEVLVSSTVRDLVAGSGIEFEDRGTRELKGVPGEWHVYAAHQLLAVVEGSRPEVAGGAAREVAAVRRSIRDRARRRRLMIATSALAIVAVVAATAFVVTRPPPSLPSVAGNAAGVIDVASGRILAQVPVGARPDGIAFAENAVWVANYTDSTVSRIDLGTRTVVQTIDVGSAPSGVAVGYGSVWVANSGGRSVSQINVTTNRVVRTINVGNGPTGVAVGAGAVWVTNALDGTVSRIDPSNGTASDPISVGASPNGIAADDSAVWVANLEPGTVSKIDVATGKVVNSIAVGNGPRGIAIGEGSVWTANSRDGTISRIDITSDRVTALIAVGEGPSGLTVAAGVAWVGSSLEDALYRIEAATNAPTRVAVGSTPQALAIANGELWFSARASAASHRGGMLHVVTSGTGLAGIDSIDPAVSFSFTGWSVLTVTNDGLVGYERVGGVGGASLVPDLAVALPRPADGGTSYTFQLRPGLTYSNGEPIVTADFRRAIERNFSVPQSPDAITGGLFLGGIVGTEACSAHVGQPCDLSAGIVTDATTITYHLTAPDPEFLYKLALPFGDAVPASAPDHDIGNQPLPATGPYMVSSYTSSEIRLVRNPRFSEWSRAAQPDGYPDEILWTIGPDVGQQLDMILAGTADVMSDRADARRMAEMQAQQPAQVHPSVLGTVTLFMNTSLAPFDDVRVRRAVNLAIDRGKVVNLLGGPLSDSVTCQIIPPNTSGYAPYCPYTLNVSPAGTWTAPDMATARDLIAASGRSRTQVEVVAIGRFRDAAAYIVDVLNGVGLQAVLRYSEEPQPIFAELSDPVTGPLVQAGVTPWIADYPAASSAMEPYGCGRSINFARFCDPAVQSLIDSAIDLQQTDPVAAGQRWSEVDRALVDLAPVAALTNPVFVDFISARVGNYQHHPEFGILLDQLWGQ
jgi:YVTN family beta-propeller protein